MSQIAPPASTIYSVTPQTAATKVLETTPVAISDTKNETLDKKNVAILVMGVTGSGKTSFINLASGSTLRVGSGLESCTNFVQTSLPFELDGRTITLIDTPGFDDTTRSDAEILKMIAVFLASFYESRESLVGVIYVHRMSDFRMSGSSARNFKMFRSLCGDSALVNVAIVTNMWGEVEKELGRAREAELATKDVFFKPVLQLGAQMVRNDNTVQSTHVIMRLLMNNYPRALRIQREMVDEHMDISQTSAGQELNRELMEQDKRNREELEIVQEEMKIAIDEKDEETRRELELEHIRLQAEIAKVESEAQNLAMGYNEEKARVKRKMQEMAEAVQQESTRAAEQQREIQEYHAQVQLNASVAAAEEAEIAKLRATADPILDPAKYYQPHTLPTREPRLADRDPTINTSTHLIQTSHALSTSSNSKLCQSSLTKCPAQGSYVSPGQHTGPYYSENAELYRQLAMVQARYAEVPVESQSEGMFTRMGRVIDSCLHTGSRSDNNGGHERARAISRTIRHEGGSKRRR